MTLPSAANAPGAERARTPWGPGSALFVALAASFAPALLWFVPTLAERLGLAPVPVSPNGLPPISSPVMLIQMIAGQLLSFAIIWFAAGRKDARTATLRLGAPQAGWLQSIGYGLLLIALILPLELVMYRLSGIDLFTDSRWLLDGLRSPLWWGVVIVAVVMAPLWEEVTYRGFLLSALAQTRLGFWPAATLSSLIWTLLHWGYSWPGLVSVFLAGIGLSWIIRRTDSMRAAVVAHGVVNAFSLAVVYLFAP